MKTSTPSKLSAGQETKYRRLLDDAAKRAADLALGKTDTDQDGWQRVLEHGDDLKRAIAEVVVAKTRELSLPSQLAGEEVSSICGYLSGYAKPKDFIPQTNRLRELFSGAGFANVELLPKLTLPAGAEGWFAIPRWQSLGKSYGKAFLKVLAALKKVYGRKFVNECEGGLWSDRFREHERTMRMMDKIAEQQNGHDILIVPAQFGIRHRGRSVRRSHEVFSRNEFGLGAFALGCMLLTHPKRLQNVNDLWIDCAGDECAPNAVGVFVHAPYFFWHLGQLRFDTDWTTLARGCCGSASGFLPQ